MNDACADYDRALSGLTRRRFLGGMAAAGAAGVVTSMFGQAVRQTAFGAEPGGNVLVVLSFRGAVDGLGMVVPHGDPAYYAARPRISVAKESLVMADSMFGLHPSMAPLQWLWDAGELAAVHAVGMAVPNRSHFVAMELVEDADPGSSTRCGWVNRMVGIGGGPATDAIHLGDAMAPALIEGPARTVAAGSLDEITLPGSDSGRKRLLRNQLAAMWAPDSGPLGDAARCALDTVQTLEPIAEATYNPTVTYPEAWPGTDLSRALRDTAQLIKADIGTEVVSVDFGGWDMHDGYGNLSSGRMLNQVTAFAGAVNAFLQDLGDLRSKVTVVTISEFGRRVAENGNRGLDHGWGNMMLLMGGGVKGGYYASWPGLGTEKLVQGDLAVTTDYRQVFGEVVSRRFPDRSLATVFPGLSYNPVGVMRAG